MKEVYAAIAAGYEAERVVYISETLENIYANQKTVLDWFNHRDNRVHYNVVDIYKLKLDQLLDSKYYQNEKNLIKKWIARNQ